MWTVDPLDWCCNSSQCVYQRVVTTVKENDIILLHDCYETSVTAALSIVDSLQAQGYEFVTVRDLFRKSGIVPQRNVIYMGADEVRNNYE